MAEKYNLSDELIDILLNKPTRKIVKYITPQNKADIINFLFRNRPMIIKWLEEYELFDENDVLNCVCKDPSIIRFVIHHKSVKGIDFKNIIISNFKPEWYSYDIEDSVAYDPILLKKYLPFAIEYSLRNLHYCGYNVPHVIVDSLEFKRGIIDWCVKNNECPFIICRLANDKDFVKDFIGESKLYWLIPKLLKLCDNVDEEIIDQLVKVVDEDIYDYLPVAVANNDKIKIKCRRAKQIYTFGEQGGYDSFGYSREWKDSSGNIIKFFALDGDFSISTKSDYYKLYKKYLEEKLSVSKFCEKYGISSTYGFQKMLDRIALENIDEKEFISDVKNEVKNDFFMTCKTTGEKLARGEIKFEDFLSDEKVNFTSARIGLFLDYLDNDLKNKFSLIVCDYIEKNQNLISYNFINFLTEFKKNPADSLKKYIRPNLKMPEDQEYIKKYGNTLLPALKKHEKRYSRAELYSAYIIDNVEYVVDDDVIDQAYAYAKSNGYYISYCSMNYLCKLIATKKLDYAMETKCEKEEIVDDIVRLILEQRTIEDYINLRQEKSVKKGR